MTGNPEPTLSHCPSAKGVLSSRIEGFLPKACKGKRKNSFVFLFPPLGLEGLGNVLAVHPLNSSSLLRLGVLCQPSLQRMDCK